MWNGNNHRITVLRFSSKKKKKENFLLILKYFHFWSSLLWLFYHLQNTIIFFSFTSSLYLQQKKTPNPLNICCIACKIASSEFKYKKKKNYSSKAGKTRTISTILSFFFYCTCHLIFFFFAPLSIHSGSTTNFNEFFFILFVWIQNKEGNAKENDIEFDIWISWYM